MTVSFLIITQLTLTLTLVPPFCHCLPLPSCATVPVRPPNGGEGRAPQEPQGHLGGISPHRKFCCSHRHTAQQMLKAEQAGGKAALSPGSKGHTAGWHSTFPQSAPQSPCPRDIRNYRDLDSHKQWPCNGQHGKSTATSLPPPVLWQGTLQSLEISGKRSMVYILLPNPALIIPVRHSPLGWLAKGHLTALSILASGL